MAAQLTIAVAQPLSMLHDVQANAEHHASAIRAASARVVVFPELSLTGYSMDAPAVGPDDPHLAPIVAACSVRNCIAIVGAPTIDDDDHRRISMLRVDRTGVSLGYDKMNLGDEESAHYVAGTAPAAFDVDGWRLGLAICKDTGVPAHTDATAALEIDVLLAGVCEAETDRDVQPQRAARISGDHQIPVAIASFAGPTGGGFDDTAGRSAIWQPDGSIAAALGAEPGQVAVVTLHRGDAGE